MKQAHVYSFLSLVFSVVTQLFVCIFELVRKVEDAQVLGPSFYHDGSEDEIPASYSSIVLAFEAEFLRMESFSSLLLLIIPRI